MTGVSGKVLLYGVGNPARGDDGLGPALAAAMEASQVPEVVVDSNYQLTVEDAAEISDYSSVVFADAAAQGPTPFWFACIDDAAVERAGNPVGWSSHSVSPAQVVALARGLFASKVTAYTLGIRGYEFGDLDETLSPRAQENLAQAVLFARKALGDRQFDNYLQEFGDPAAGDSSGGSNRKAQP